MTAYCSNCYEGKIVKEEYEDKELSDIYFCDKCFEETNIPLLDNSY